MIISLEQLKLLSLQNSSGYDDFSKTGQFMITLIHREDMRKLDVGQHIVVGTPGRVFDMISRKVIVDRYNILLVE